VLATVAKTRVIAQWSAGVGAVAWVGLRVAVPGRIDTIDGILLAAVLVGVPLTLSVLPLGPMPLWSKLLRGGVWLQIPAGAAAAAGLALDAGPTAGALTGAWMGLTLLLAAMALPRLGKLRRADGEIALAEICFVAALVYLPVGGFWLTASRLGVTPFDFDPLIVTLTAVHFHYAGFAAPVLAGLALRQVRLRSAITRASAYLVAAAVTLGQPLVAAGITASPEVGLAGTALIALGLTALAVLTLSQVLGELRSRGSKLLLVISSLSVLLSMPLAVAWAWGEVTGQRSVGMLWMIRIHGMANAHGFALCGLLAWALEQKRG